MVSSQKLSREGQRPSSQPHRPKKVDAVTPAPFSGRAKPASAQVDTDLLSRGLVSQLDLLRRSSTWKLRDGTSGRTRAYSDDAVRAVLQVMAVYSLPMRQAEGFLREQVLLHGGDPVTVPDHSTVCRRRRELNWQLPTAQGSVWALDGTGIGVSGNGDHARLRFKDARKCRFVKLHAVVDLETGLVVAATVTDSEGEGSADVSQAQPLLGQVEGTLTHLLGDGAYDSKVLYQACRDRGGVLLAPLPANAVYSGSAHPDRNMHKAQVGRLGEDTYRKRSGYHYRALVECFFSALKRSFSQRVRARTLTGARAELMAWIETYNRWVTAKTV